MSLPKWLQIAFQFAPMVLGVIPATAPIAGAVSDAIEAAEMLPNASGDQKKQYVMQIAADAVTSANAKGAKLDPAVTLAAASSAIDTTIGVINAVHAATPAAPAPVQPPSAT